MKKHLPGLFLLLSMLLPASLTCALATDYTYAAAGRLVGAAYDIGASITYAYDAKGNLAQRTANTPALGGSRGDINADSIVNLADVVAVLKILTGQQPDSMIDVANSIDGGLQIDMKDAVYILGEMVK